MDAESLQGKDAVARCMQRAYKVRTLPPDGCREPTGRMRKRERDREYNPLTPSFFPGQKKEEEFAFLKIVLKAFLFGSALFPVAARYESHLPQPLCSYSRCVERFGVVNQPWFRSQPANFLRLYLARKCIITPLFLPPSFRCLPPPSSPPPLLSLHQNFRRTTTCGCCGRSR